MTATAILAKTCRVCGESTPFHGFNKDRTRKDGLSQKCRVCAKAAMLIYQAANPERLRERSKRSYEKNREKKIAAAIKWSKENADKVISYQKNRYQLNKEKINEAALARYHANPGRSQKLTAAWRKKNPSAVKAWRVNRRSRKNNSQGKLSKDLSLTLFALQKGRCPCCKQLLGDDYHLDHKMPLALGGSNTDDNMQLLRSTCNLQKHAKHPIDFMQERGFLL